MIQIKALRRLTIKPYPQRQSRVFSLTLGLLIFISWLSSDGAPASVLAYGLASVWWLLSDGRLLFSLGWRRCGCEPWLFVLSSVGKTSCEYSNLIKRDGQLRSLAE